jgi:AcrR family transcriptional regulator
MSSIARDPCDHGRVTESGVRTWGGTTLAARQTQRRRRLLDVGLELMGTEGAAAVTVRSVCRASQLTDRYFYESFADRDALLLAVYDEVAAEFGAALVEVVGQPHSDEVALARSAVEAFLDVMVADPRKGRVLLLEPMAHPQLSEHGLAISPMFVALVSAQLGEDADPMQAQLTATSVVGALTTLFIRWLDGSLSVERDVLAEFCVRLVIVSVTLANG